MNEQIAVALLSVMIGFFSAGFAGASLFYSRSQMKTHEKRTKHATTLDFHRIWMSGDMYHARTIAGMYCASKMGQSELPFSDVHRENPEASESMGRVMHFIVEMMAAYHAGLLDNDLARSLFRSTFSEWEDNLSIFAFSDSLFHDDFRRSIKNAVKIYPERRNRSKAKRRSVQSAGTRTKKRVLKYRDGLTFVNLHVS